MLTDSRNGMPTRRIKELLAESEMQLASARAVQTRAVVWSDPDGPQRREAATAWADAFVGRIVSLKGMLAARGELREAV